MSEHELIGRLRDQYKTDKGELQLRYLEEVKRFIKAFAKGELSWEKFLKALHYSSAAHLRALKNKKNNIEENEK